MNTRVNAANLAQAAKILMLDWTRTKEQWRDVKSREFEEQFLANLPHHMARAGAVMEEIDNLLRKVKSDCE